LNERRYLLEIPALWAMSGWSWIQLETETGVPESDLRQLLDELGFRRSPGTAGWVAGPCASCERVRPPELLDEDFRCSNCRDKPVVQVDGYPWGTEPAPDSDHWFALEREASFYRRFIRDGSQS
jgi:hypothetical protein